MSEEKDRLDSDPSLADLVAVRPAPAADPAFQEKLLADYDALQQASGQRANGIRSLWSGFATVLPFGRYAPAGITAGLAITGFALGMLTDQPGGQSFEAADYALLQEDYYDEAAYYSDTALEDILSLSQEAPLWEVN